MSKNKKRRVTILQLLVEEGMNFKRSFSKAAKKLNQPNRFPERYNQTLEGMKTKHPKRNKRI